MSVLMNFGGALTTLSTSPMEKTEEVKENVEYTDDDKKLLSIIGMNLIKNRIIFTVPMDYIADKSGISLERYSKIENGFADLQMVELFKILTTFEEDYENINIYDLMKDDVELLYSKPSADKLKSLRKQSKELQKDVAISIGIKPYLLSLYENWNKDCPLDVAIKLAEHYGVDIIELF